MNDNSTGLIFFFKNRKTLFIAALLGGILGVVATFFTPKKYLSTAIIYPYNSHKVNDIISNPQFGYEIETEQLIDGTALRTLNDWQDTLGDSSIESIVISNKYKQILTHQKIWGIFYEIAIEEKLDEERIQKLSLIPVQKSDLEKFAFPKIIDLFLKDKTLSLKLF